MAFACVDLKRIRPIDILNLISSKLPNQHVIEPIAIVLGGAKPGMQRRCPCKIVSAGRTCFVGILVHGKVSPGIKMYKSLY